MSWGKRKDGQAYKKTSSSKSRKSGSIQASGIKLKTQKSEPFDELGLAKEGGNEFVRTTGNQVITDIVNMEKRNDPKLKDFKIHSTHVFNEYSTIQNEMYHSKRPIEKLIKWRNDGRSNTWKWLSPITLENKVQQHLPVAGKKNTITDNPLYKMSSFDGHNLGWLTDAYKGRAAITVMTPRQFLDKSDPTRDIENSDNKYTKKTIDELAKKMRNQTPIDTPFLLVDENLVVYQHEGRHRASAAIKAGIKEMPVYIYGREPFTNDQLSYIATIPNSVLTLKRQQSQ